VDSRRTRLLALSALLLIVAIALIVVLSNGGSTPRTSSPPSTSSRSPQAADRAAIQHVAQAWQRSLNPHSPDNPCRYMTEQYSANVQVEVGTGGTTRALTCPEAVRKELIQGGVIDVRREVNGSNLPLYQAVPGLAQISFSSAVPVRGTPSSAPGAVGRWRGQGYPPVSFVRERGQWLVAG
jgi:hypothetical protein